MAQTVFSVGRLGPTAVAQDRAADVHLYASRLIQAGHQDVSVGATREHAIPYSEWRKANQLSTPDRAVLF